MDNKRSAIVMGATSGIGYEVALILAARKVAVSIVDGIERRKPVITINWFYRLLVFFWQMIPRSIWIKMKVK